MAFSRRSPRAAFFHLFDDASNPVYAVDGQRRVIYANSALERWLGISASELVGCQCDYHADANSPAASDGESFVLGPPPTAFEGQFATGTVARRSVRLGNEIRAARHWPLHDEQGKVLGVATHVGGQVSESRGEDTEFRTLHQQILGFRARYPGDYALERLIGSSASIRLVRDRITLATSAPTRVVISGPKGSGREHVARTIHYQTQVESLPPLVPLDCSLLDAELLGTTVEAFLQRCGELQSEGTPCLLLMEVDQLSLDAQEVLCNVLTIQGFELRTVATSRAPLADLVVQGFSAEAAAMLSTLTITLPSLSERLEDIPILLQYALESYNAAREKQVAGFDQDALRQMIQYPWPGNVDELLEVVGEIHTSAPKAKVTAKDLPKQIRLGIDADEFPHVESESIQLDEYLQAIERELVLRAVRQAGGNKAEAARALGITRSRLLRRLTHFGIEPTDA